MSVRSHGPVTADTHEWVCSRCVREHNEPELGRRFRFGGETCPRCTNPGCGMVLMPKRNKVTEAGRAHLVEVSS